jgi:hypothetical protein
MNSAEVLKVAHSSDLLQAARSEDLLYEQISELSVLGDHERNIVDTLKRSGAHLLQGARGVGKSMLLRKAEVELDRDFPSVKTVGVYVNFKTSTLLEGVKAENRDAFQIWVGLRVLQELHEKLMRLNVLGTPGIADPYERVFGIGTSPKVSSLLEQKRHLLQKLASSSDRSNVIRELGEDFLAKVSDTNYLVDTIRVLIDQFALDRVIFLFDEAAHTFIPEQQEVFFEIFKLLHGGRVAVKAAVYPTVTSYGRNFEVGQDAIVISLDRFEPGQAGRSLNRSMFRDMLERRIPPSGSLRKKLFAKGALLDLCIDLSTGNPRAFFHLLNRVLDKGGLSDRSVLLATQEYVDEELLPYHQNLSKRLPKYATHVRVGLELLRGYIVREIRLKNSREKKSNYQSAFFTTPRDISPNLRLALDLLSYSGVLTNKGTVKIADRQTGHRYMVHLALMSTERAFATSKLSDAIQSLSLTDYREFAADDPEFSKYLGDLTAATERCPECSTPINPNAKFCTECGVKVQTTGIIGKLLEEPIAGLSVSARLKTRLQPKYKTVGDIVQAERSEIMTIPYIKEVRSRIIKNAADEFISG